MKGTKMEDDGKPWDIKSIKISLGGETDGNGFVEAEVFDNDHFRLTFENVTFSGYEIKDGKLLRGEITLEDINIDFARRLRDFLNYAVK